ncbi:hypothetical protein HPB49_016388 [Dermacentor silvarum]|uniref:Uncharacterized protein n=1 Tax=Dermacentor silvarum TaxID=543639 RepID=A0ACB8DJQ2_DERSI|nr:hypothetical protein HPB49_016388 [Dermacentor silvarum]
MAIRRQPAAVLGDTVADFDLEDGPGGPGGGRALLEASSPSGAGLVLSNFPPQRRESFLYRSDSEFEMSPKSVSRHSSIGSEATSAVAPQTSVFASSLQRPVRE